MIDDEGGEEDEDDGMSEGEDESVDLVDDDFGGDDGTGSGSKIPSKEDDEILEGDIVVVTALPKDSNSMPHLLKTNKVLFLVVLHYSLFCFIIPVLFPFPNSLIPQNTKRKSVVLW